MSRTYADFFLPMMPGCTHRRQVEMGSCRAPGIVSRQKNFSKASLPDTFPEYVEGHWDLIAVLIPYRDDDIGFGFFGLNLTDDDIRSFNNHIRIYLQPAGDLTIDKFNRAGMQLCKEGSYAFDSAGGCRLRRRFGGRGGCGIPPYLQFLLE